MGSDDKSAPAGAGAGGLSVHELTKKVMEIVVPAITPIIQEMITEAVKVIIEQQEAEITASEPKQAKDDDGDPNKLNGPKNLLVNEEGQLEKPEYFNVSQPGSAGKNYRRQRRQRWLSCYGGGVVKNSKKIGGVRRRMMAPIMNTNKLPTIWRGVLEWNDRLAKDHSEALKFLPCVITSNAKEGEQVVKVDNWPPKLVMQLLPKQLIGSIGEQYLKNSTSVLFHPTPCPALEALTKVMSNHFAGCVQFISPNTSDCNPKVLILLYSPEKNVYLGFIPMDQGAFVDRLHKLIQQRIHPNRGPIPYGGIQGLSTNGSQTPISSENVLGQPGHMGGGIMPMPFGNMNE